jgi:hypothetical protein
MRDRRLYNCFMVAVSMINFIMHEARKGQQGAREDFEQMLGLLVQATHGDAHLIFANPGDWGIDVLIGNLNGRVAIWQAKYFIREFKEPQKSQVVESFRSAVQNSARHGYVVDRWVLCVPISLDPPAMRWWQDWQARREREHPGIIIELWDENKLRSMLITPEASHVCRAFYGPSSGTDTHEAHRVPPSAAWTVMPAASWQGGAEYEFGQEVYLLHSPACEWTSHDKSYTWREATAERIEPAPATDRVLVRLRQIHVNRHTTAAEDQLAGLRAQSVLLTRLGGQAGLPRLVGEQAARDGLTLVTAHPPGRGWRELLGTGFGPRATVAAAATFAAAADVAEALVVLHANGASHRALHPGALFIEGSRCRLRDAGLAAIPPVVGEGSGEADWATVWQAPEQRRFTHAAGLATDVYRLAAIVYHTLTGHPPSPTSSPPVRVALPDLPENVDLVLLRSLDANTARRPGIGQLVAAFRDGRRALSLGGGT